MIARALVFLIAGGLLALRAGAQPPPPVCDTCVNPVTITITPTTPTTDTLRSRSETISICASPLVSDSAEWNGATITGLTISNGCATKTASYTYHVGSNKWQAWGCSGLGGGDNKGECINQSLSIQHPALGVNPKGTTVDVADSTIAKELFTVSNYDTASHTYTLTLTCTSTVTSCSASPASSITVNPGLQGTDTVTYRAGATGTTGTIQLKATAAGNSDSAIVTVRAISALTVSTAFMNQDDQDMTRCAVSCFAATTGLSTVPIISKGLPRGISLVYHGDRVAVRPFLYMDVTASNSTPALQDLQLTAQYQVNGSWIAMTFVNGDRTLHFAGSQLNAKPADTFRLGAQVDVSSLASTAWAAAPLKITLVAVYSDHQEFYTDSSQTLSVVSERASPIAAGWSVAGVPHLYGRSDNTASQIVVKEGNGSTTLYNGNNCVPNCIWMPAGPGVFSRIDYLWGAPDSMVYIRSYPDSTREYFYGSRVNSGAIGRRVDRFQDTVLFKYDTLGRLDSITDPYRTASGAHLAWQIKYGPNGIDSIIEPLTAGVSNARKTTDSVDVNHLLRKWTDPDGASTRFGYDADNRLNSITDRNGNTTTFKYDTLWKLDTIVSPQVPIDNHGTGSPTNQSLMTVYQDWQEAGVPYKHTSDSVASQWQPARTDTIRGRTTDPLGYVHAIQPDRWGQALALTDPLGNTMTYARDQNGMPETVTYPTGAQDQFTFSGPLLTQSTPAYQTVTTYYAYGPFAIPDSVYGTGIPTTYNYFTVAGRGRIDSTRVGAGNKATHYTYDNFFRVTQAVDPLGDTTHMGYDAISGNLDSSQALPSQRLATTTFDHVGRDSIDVVTSYTIRQSTTKLYDPMNRVIGLLDGVHTGDTIKYHYDSLYLRSTTDLKGQVYQTTYNPLGWPVTQVDPANRTTTATYNALGLPMTATNRRGQMMTYSYDITGRLTGVHKPSVRSEADAADTVVYSVTGDVVRDSNAVQKNVTYVSDASNWTDSTITYFVTHGTWWKRHYFHSALGQIDSIVFTTNATGAPPHTRHFGWDAAAGVLDSILGRHDCGNALGVQRSVDAHHDYLSHECHSDRQYLTDSRARLLDVFDDEHLGVQPRLRLRLGGTDHRGRSPQRHE